MTRILTITRHTACHMAPFSKEDNMLIKSLYECKGYNAPQFITEFPDKGWTKNSISRLLVTGAVNCVLLLIGHMKHHSNKVLYRAMW